MAVQIKKARLPPILCFALSLLVKGADTHFKKTAGPAPLDFIESESVIKEHIKVKNDVLDLLYKFAEETDGFVIEQINQDITKIKIRGVGRVINILSSGIAIAFAVNPVFTSAGITIGYIVQGGSIWYEMKCYKKHAENLESIQERLQIQLYRYTSSQEKVFKDLEKYEVFEHDKNFEENLAAIKALVREAEKQGGEKFSNMKNLLCNLEIFFNNLEDLKKKTLNSKDFLPSVSNLLGISKEYSDEYSEELGSAGRVDWKARAGGSVVIGASTEGNKPAWSFGNYIHGINILGNLGFIAMDINEYLKLSRMQQDWYEGGEKKQTLLGNSKFDIDVKMKTIIHQIRDKINANGY